MLAADLPPPGWALYGMVVLGLGLVFVIVREAWLWWRVDDR